jgi:L-threonylcarbamoyladenylate synthase
MIFKATPESLNMAATRLKLDDVVVFPTETVYGMGALALNETGVQKIFTRKNRPHTNPLIVHVASVNHIFSVALVSKRNRRYLELLSSFIPGPLTVILPKHPCIPSITSGGHDTVAVRVPLHPVAQQLLHIVDAPIAAPSANRSTYVSPTTAEHVEAEYGNDADLVIIDGGPCKVGIESTIISLVGKENEEGSLNILRPGVITAQQLSDALGEPVLEPHQSAIKKFGRIASPGDWTHLHYAPLTPLFLFENLELTKGLIQPKNKDEAIVIINASDSSLVPVGFAEVRFLSLTGNFEEIAASLFSVLRELDTLKLSKIFVELCRPEGIGIAIRDRLNRAARRRDGTD